MRWSLNSASCVPLCLPLGVAVAALGFFQVVSASEALPSSTTALLCYRTLLCRCWDRQPQQLGHTVRLGMAEATAQDQRTTFGRKVSVQSCSPLKEASCWHQNQLLAS